MPGQQFADWPRPVIGDAGEHVSGRRYGRLAETGPVTRPRKHRRETGVVGAWQGVYRVKIDENAAMDGAFSAGITGAGYSARRQGVSG